MSIQAPQGILNIPNATLRVGKLAVDEVVGADTILNTVARNTILLVDDEAYHENKNWSLKLPNAWAGEFECNTASAGNYSEFNFYNEGASSNAQGYNLTFNDTAVELRYDGTLLKTGTLASTITGTGVKKVRLMFERTILSVTVDGTLVFTHDDTVGPRPRVYSTTAGGFLNFFTDGGALKNLKIVNEKWMSDGTSNIAYVGGGEVAVGQALAFNRVSNVSQIKVDSNVVTEYTGPHDRPLRKYPEVAMTGPSQDGYVASASTEYNTTDRAAFNAFRPDTLVSESWFSGGGKYDADGTTSASASTFQGESGEYIKLELPKKIKLSHVKFTAVNATINYRNPPRKGIIWGSNDDVSWSQIHTFDVGESESNQIIQINVNADTHYKYIVLQATEIGGDNALARYVRIRQLQYYGYEEGSGSIDTTLKSVYNVPATTGTQLEVYYDGRETSSYSGSGTNVNDISPNTNNGTLNGGAGFDSTYKAFTFDGTDDYIRATIPGVSDDYIHSISMWVKFTAMNDTVLEISGSTRQSNSVIGVYIDADGTLAYYFYDNDARYHTNLLVNQWYHIGLTYSGSGKRNVYINGIESRFKTSYGDLTQSLTLAGGTMTIGNTIDLGANFFNGSIANFRLYSKALNADQVKELYDYQKDYFLGSKSQVTLYKGHLGVGVTEPSGQLELAGDERIQEYPPGPMGRYDYETLIPGHGVFCAYASVDSSPHYYPGGVFDKTANIFYWDPGSGGTRYSTSSPGNYLKSNRLAAETVLGEYLVLKLPYKIKLDSFSIARQNSGWWIPQEIIYYAKSEEEDLWEQIHSHGSIMGSYANGVESSDGTDAPIHREVKSTKFYRYFALVITKSNGGGGTSLNEWKLFGTPGPTTLDKGSLSLGRSLDVPRVSRYDVDTETPRPEKLLVDFDTTVNSSPTDISGQGNHGTFYGGAYYSAAEKAFFFDGTDDYIDIPSVSGVGTGAWVHSKSFWFKLHSSTDPGILFLLGRNGSTRQIAVQVNGSGQFQYFIYGCNSRVQVNGSDWFPDVNRWYHCVTVFRNNETTADGSVLTGREMYIDGVKQTLVAIGNQIALDLDSSEVRFGNQFNSNYLDYELSNPKLYSVALEPSEVQKLYRLGRTGRSMVISDTAVGIGKVPEAQLDVRGVIKGTGALTTGLPWFYARNQTQLTTGSTSYNVTSTHLQESNDALGTMYSTSYACLFPIKGIYIFSAQVHSVFGSAHNATFDGVVRYSNGGQYYNVYSPTKIGPTVVNYDTHASCIFIITAIEDGMYLELNHITSASVQRNYNGQWNRNWGVCIYAL